MMLPVSGSSNSPFSGLGKAPPLSHRGARWYRFEIDCGAYPSGVSVKSLMREADGQRRRKHSSSTTSSGGQKSSATLVAAASKSTAGALDKAASVAGAAGGAPSPASAPTRSPSESAPSARDKVDGGSSTSGSVTGLDSQKPKVPEEQGPGEHGDRATGSDGIKKHDAVPVPADGRAEGATGSGTENGGPADVGQSTDGEIAVEDGSRAPTKTGSGTSSAAETQTGQGSTSASEVEVAAKGSSSSTSSGSGKAGATPAATQAPLPSTVETPAVRLQDSPQRGRRMNLIEQLELKYGHTAFGLPTSSEEDSYGSEESMLDPDEDSGGDGGNGGGGGASGADDTGVAKSRKRKKPKRKKGLPGDDLDYDDDFIDDSELEKAYYAKEASSKAKTLHSGFFANQGAVETIMTPKASMKARGCTGQGSAGEGKGSGAGGAGAGGNSSGGDGDPAAKKKKKKPKVVSASATGTSGSATTDGGETTPGPAKKKARKSPAEGGNAKKAQKVKSSGSATSATAVVASAAAAGATSATSSDAAAAAAAAATPAATMGTAGGAASDGVPATVEIDSSSNTSSNNKSNGAAVKVNQGDGTRENNGGDSLGGGAKTGDGSCEGGGRGDDGIDEVTAKPDGDAVAGIAVIDVGTTEGDALASSGSNPVPAEAEPSGANALLSPEKNPDSRPTPGSGASGAGQNTIDPDTGGSGGKGAASGGGGGGEKNGGKSAARPATMESWDPSLVQAVSRFEEDSKAWVDAGRQEGEGAARILEGMRTVDALVRQSVPDAHSTRSYLERLSAVCGRPAPEVKGILLGLKDEEDKRESARLHEEFDTLRSAFVSKVKETVSQQQEATATTTVATTVAPTVAPGAKPPAPPFAWSPALREALHDLLRAFEAWIVKAHGGQRTKQAVIETKAMYDQLVLEWPAEMGMTVEELKKIYLYQKRRIRVRANKEAAAETPTLPANPAAGAAAAVSEGATLTGGQQPDPGRDTSRKESLGSAPRKDREDAKSGPRIMGSTAGTASNSCPRSSSPTSSSMIFAPNSPDDASPALSTATQATSDTPARRLPGSVDNAAWMFPLGTPTPAGAAAPPGAGMMPPPPRTSSTLTGSTATNPRIPVRGTRFEAPPVYEERDFFEVYGDEEVDVEGGFHPGYESLTDNGD